MSPIKTILPPDELIIQSTELSGMPVFEFEEVIDLDEINQLTDPYKEHLLELAKGANPSNWRQKNKYPLAPDNKEYPA